MTLMLSNLMNQNPKCQIDSISQQDSQYYHVIRIGLLS